MTPFLRPILLAAAVLLTVDDGCGRGGTGVIPGEYDDRGTAYRLVSIDGAPLPGRFLFSQPVTIRGSSLCLFPDSQFRRIVDQQSAFGPNRDLASDSYGVYAFASGSGTVGAAPATKNAAGDSLIVTYSEPAKVWVYVLDPGVKTTVCITQPHYY